MTRSLPTIARLIVALLAAACQPSPPPATAPMAVATEAPALAFGLFQLQSLSGHDVATAKHHPIYLIEMTGRWDIASQCVPFWFAYRHTGADGAIAVNDAMPEGIPICARALTPIETDLPKILLAATTRTTRPDGAIVLSGPAGEAVFAKPRSAVINPFGHSPPSTDMTLWGEWRVAAVNGVAAPTETVRIAFGFGKAEAYDAILVLAWRYGQPEMTRVTSTTDGFGEPVIQPGPSPFVAALAKALAGDVRMSSDGPLRRVLSGAGGVVELVRA
jgi:hypothetical protein